MYTDCLFMYFQLRFKYMIIFLLVLYHKKIKGIILLFKSNSIITLNSFVAYVFKPLQIHLIKTVVLISLKFQISIKTTVSKVNI